MLVALTNTKGGVGKSTLASHLAIWLFDAGYRVGLLDGDPQETSARWVRNAEPLIPVVTAPDLDAVERARKELEATSDIIIADTPGNKGSESAQAITLLADIAVIPLQPSKPDLREIGNALKFVKLGQQLTGGKRPEAVLVLTMTAKSDIQTRQLREELNDFGVPVAATEIRRLNAFRDACDSSVTRSSFRDAKAAANDIETLFSELFKDRLQAFSRLGKKAVANG